jgi:dTDP-4-dehydrorhamnose reductase
MRVAVLGANGQLGTDVCAAYVKRGDDLSLLTHDNFDVRDIEAGRNCLARIRPNAIVNTTAMHQVDQCEQRPEESFAVNGVGARNLALISNELDCVLVHVSTDYVFDGRKQAPYVESDCPFPLNVYGNTKLAGEIFVRTIARRHFVVRVSALFGGAPCRAKGGMNFVQLMLHLARTRGKMRVVDDEFVSPTYTADVAAQIVELSGTKDYGLYHATAEGQCSWYGFAQKIVELGGVGANLEVADPGEFPAKTPRPKYTVLENANLKSIGKNMMPHWSDGLRRYLSMLSNNNIDQ